MPGALTFNEPLAPHTAWRIGGCAERYYRPKDVEDLLAFLRTVPSHEPLTWLGLGSNVLIADEGIAGTVIHTLGMGAQEPTLLSNAPIIVRAEVGLPCAKLAKFCSKQGLAGGAFFAGIPGTIGGALAMNAGAFGGVTWSYVTQVEVTNRLAERLFRKPESYQIGYRTLQMPFEEWFIAGHFQFKEGSTTAAHDIKELLRRRRETQPIGALSCGSVFKNPPGHFAAQLIESVHLKGYKVGDAEVSPKHANFIINHGKARALDVLAIMRHIIETVFQQYQICLEPEVKLLGFKSQDWK